MLSRFPFAEELTAESRSSVEKELQSFSVKDRTLLIRKGDTVGGVYLVEEGSLRVYSMNANGRESTLYWIEPGESCILAMNCVFSNILYPAWVESARVDTKFAMIPSHVYRRIHETEPSVQRFTFEVLSARIFDLMSTLEDVTTLPLDRRLANFVLKRSSSDLRLAMSHEEIASHLGTAREVVSRHLGNLEKAGLIQVGRGHTVIVSVDGLRSFIFE
jgi:CRP/FNR family transcriptional regulator, anaerobic regulatory protein